jgi:hypothetical protein
MLPQRNPNPTKERKAIIVGVLYPLLIEIQTLNPPSDSQ